METPGQALPAEMAARIVARIDELAAISETPGALTRICFSPEHARAADVILGWMREAGLDARMDEIGNVIGRYEGVTPGLPALMIGSHYDSVRDAGKWDGPLGLILALECVAEIARLPSSVEEKRTPSSSAKPITSRAKGSRTPSRAISATHSSAMMRPSGPSHLPASRTLS